MKKFLMILSTVLVVGLASLVGVNSTSAASTSKLEYSLGELKAINIDKSSEVKSVVVKLSGPDYKTILSNKFVVKKNGDTVEGRKMDGAWVIDVTEWKDSDKISIGLVGGTMPSEIVSGSYSVLTRGVNGYDGVGTQGSMNFYTGSTDEERTSFFKGRLLGEVEIQEIPITMVKALKDGGILSVALITFASLLVAGLVVRYLHSLRSFR